MPQPTLNLSRRTCALLAIPLFLGLVNGAYNAYLVKHAPALFWLADVLMFGVVPAGILWWLAKAHNILPRHYGLKFPLPSKGELFITIPLLAGALVVWSRFWWTVASVYLPGAAFFFYEETLPDGLARIPVVFYYALTAGVVESIFYLGIPWLLWRQDAERAAQPGFFIFLSATAFAAIHWEQGLPNMIAAGFFGVLAGIIYRKMGDLWPIIGAHTLIDFMHYL